MEDEERQKKLEAGKAKLAEYRQRKAQADGQKKQKKKKKSPGTGGVNAPDGPDHDQSLGEDPSEQSTGREVAVDAAEFTISKALRSGDTIKQDQTYTIEPESEVSTTADDYTSEVNGCSAVLKIEPSSEDVIREEDVHVPETRSENQAQSSRTRHETMEDELAGKQQAIEELSRELEVMRSAIGTEGLQQLQDFEAAVKQRDGIITQLTANLQQARKEKDEIMREFLELTEQSQKLQIQFQQLQAGETLRNTSHSSTAADFLQAKQQNLKNQQQIEQQELQLKSYQSKSEEYQLQINLLQDRVKEFETASETLRNTAHSRTDADLLQAKQQILIYQQQIEEQELQLKSYQSKSEEYQLQINLLQERVKEFEMFANEQEGSVSQRLQEKEQLIEQQENTITEHKNTETELKEKLLASDMLLEDLSKERCQDIETLKTELNNSKQRERQSSSEIKQLMGTVEELQKRYHKGNLSGSEIIQKMEVDTQKKMDQLRAELDEMYGQQIVQMKQELRKQHMAEMDKLIAQHRSEHERRQVHPSGSVANEDQVNLMNMAINELNAKLQEAQLQKDQLKQERSQQLAKFAEEKSSLQTQVEDLLEDLRFAREKAQRASRSISEQEHKLGEVGNLQATIGDLKYQLVAAAESTKELESKHESEVTNYKIKLEMLEREKDAVLDRMAESQEAELERLRTQLLFSHEEELIKLKEDLQRESQINIENLKDDLALKYKQKLERVQKGFNEQLESVKIERDSLVTEKEALISDISKMKEDLNQSLESSKTEEMTLQIKELKTEIQALQKVEKEKGTLEHEIQQLLAKNEVLEKQIKKKEDDMYIKIKELEDETGRLKKSRELLEQKLQASNLASGMSASDNSAATCAVGMETQTFNEQLQIERLASENEQLKNQQVQLKEEVERQRNTYSFAEKNFEVNYQELKDEYTCLLKVKAGLEERIVKERVQYEAKMDSLRTQITFLQSEKEKMDGSGVLAVKTSKVGKTVWDCIDGGEIIEKDKTELMEKLEVAQREKKELYLRLSEVSDTLNLKQNEIEQLKNELRSVKDEYRQNVGKHKELDITRETRVKTLEYQTLEYIQSSGITATEIVGTGSCTLENHHHQIALLEEKVIALQTSLQTATLEQNKFQEKEKSLIHEKESLLAKLQELKGKSVTESPAVASVQTDSYQLQQLDAFKTEQLGMAKLVQQKALVEESLHKKLEEKEKTLIAAEKKVFNLHERLNKQYQRDCADEKHNEEMVECSGIEQDEKDIVDNKKRTQLITAPLTENWPGMETNQQLTEAEFRLQMEAQRISLTQIYAAQLELVHEKLQTDKQCLSLLEEDLTTRHRQEVEKLHKKYQQEKKTDDRDERMSSQQQIQKLSKLVSEECKQLILSFGSVFGEEELEALQYNESEEAKRSRDESSAGIKEQTGDPSSLLHEAKEMHTELQKLKDKILQEYNSLTGLQTLLKSDSRKLEELQKAYVEFRYSSEEEMTSLRLQIESARASSEDFHDLKEQLKVRSAHLEEIEKLKEEIEKLKSEFNQQRTQFEDQHTQEIECLRMYYQQQIKETEERYTTEMIVLQQRLQEVTGSEAQFSISSDSQFTVQKDNDLEQQCTEEIKLEDGLEAEHQYPIKSMRLTQQLQTLRRALYAKYLQEVTALKEQHKAELDLLASRLMEQHSLETKALPQGITESAKQDRENMNGGFKPIKEPESSEITGKSAMQTIESLEKWYKKKIEEEIAKVIVQMSIEFAQQTELARITKKARETTSEMQTVSEDPEREAESKTEDEPGLVFESNRQELERKVFEKQLKEKTEEVFLLRNQIRQTSCTRQMSDKECQFPEINIELSLELATKKKIVLRESMVYREGTSAEALSSAGDLDQEHQEDLRHEQVHLDQEQTVEPVRHSHLEQLERHPKELHSLRAQLAQNSSVDDVSVGEEERINAENQDTINTSVSAGKLSPEMQNSSTQTEQNEEGDNQEVPREASPHPEASAKRAEKPDKPASDDLTVERNILQKVNERLRIVLSEVLKTTAAAEETIGRHVEGLLVASSKGQRRPQRAEWEQAAEDPLKPHIVQGHRAGGDVSSESCQGSDAGGDDASVWSGETDEGLEMSQRLADGMFTGAELDLENEEFMVNISTRLQVAVEKLLEAITETTNQLEHAKITQIELTRESFKRNAEISELVKRQEELQERLSEETKAREQLALELHKAEGILDGYAGERVALEGQVKQKAEIQQHLEQELQLTSSRLQELEQERQIMRQERELLSRQQDAMRDTAGSKELHLLEETEKIMKEKVEVQRQAEKENGELLKQVKTLESELEEQVNKVIEIEQEKKAEIMDLRQQIQALEKQLEKNRKFLDEQAIDREHERDVFQQEIQKLEQQLKYPQKLQSSTEQRNKEVEVLTNQLKDKTDRCSELVLGKEQLQRDVQERNEEIEKLGSQIRELEQALISNSDRLQKLEEIKQYTPVEVKGEITLEAQLKTEREALDRKEKEISNLEEQLEQFREELENKNEEVQQLHMQMEIQRKELSTQRQEHNHQNTLLKNQVEALQKSLNDSDDVSIEDHRIVIGKFSQVMEEKDKEIEHLNEQLYKCQQQLEIASDNKVIEEKNEQMRELESEIECLKSEQERLKRKSEDEIEQLNEVIEKLQQELAKIEHKTQDDDPEEPSSLKHPLEVMVEEKEAPKVQEEKGCKEINLTKEEFEGMKVKIQQANQELETLKADNLNLLQKYKCLQEERSVTSVEKISNTTAELEEALPEKTATVVVIQAEIKALEESANAKITNLEAKQEELEASVREKNAELDLCRSQKVQAQTKTEVLKQKVIELEDKLREKVAAALVSQAQLGAVQEQSKVHTKQLHSQIEELQGHSVTDVGQRETAEVAETVAEATAVTHGFTKPDNEKQDSKTDQPKNKLSVLTLKLTELEKELAELQKDRELQRQLVHSTEEGVVEYEKKLAQLLARLDQMKKPMVEKEDAQTSKARTTKPESDKTISASELALELEQVKYEAAATKEELNSYRERAKKLKDDLQVRELTISQLQENLEQAMKTKPERDEPTAASKLASGQEEAKSKAAATQEELNSYKEQAEKLKDELQATQSKTESDEPAPVSKLLLELEEVKSEAAITKEELNSYRKQAGKLKNELQVREMTIEQLRDDLKKATKSKLESDEPAAISKLALELEEVKSEAAVAKEELNSYRKQAEQLKDELQATKTKLESDEPADVSKLVLELEEVKSEAASMKAELNKKRAENLKDELQVTQSKTENDEPAAVSKLLLALEEVKSEAAVANEELNSYRKQAEKLKDELQVRKLTIEQLQDDLKEATKSKLESDEHAAVSKLLLELEEVKSEAVVAKEELNSYRKQAEKLKDELQATKSNIESDEPVAVSKLVLELEGVKSDAVSMNAELNSSKEQTEKLKDVLQVKETKLGSDEPADVSKLVLELEEVKSEAASMKEELNIYRKRAEKLKDELQERELTIANLQDDLQQATKHKPQSNEPVAISKLVLELEEVKSEAAATKEELNSYRERAEKLKEDLQMRDLTIPQLQEDLKQVKEALAKAEEELGHRDQKRDTKLFEGKPDIVGDKTKHTSTKEKPSLVRKNSASQTDKPANMNRSFQTPNVLCKDAEIQIDLIKQNSSSSEQLAEVIRQYKEKIGQMQELHAAEIMDMETRHICESDTLKSESQILREQCKALNAFLEKIRATGGISASVLESGSSQFRDGYTSDSSSDWSQRMYYDFSVQNQEYRSTPEEAKRDNEMPQASSEMLPDRIKYLLREVHQEGMQVLSLSEVPCIEGEIGTSEHYSESWQKERQALLATVESLKVLITNMQVYSDTETSLNFASAEGVADWRGELLQAIQQVFLKERSVLKSALETHMASLETSDIVVHLNQLENCLREQDVKNRDAMEILQDADRNSLLMEIGQLQAQLQRAQQGDRAAAQLAQQTSSDGHQDCTLQDNQASFVELEVNRVKESGSELKDRFHAEKMVIAKLKNELAQTKLELETTLKAQQKHLKELETLRTEVSEKTAEMDMLNDALANEQKKSRELQWAFEKEKCKAERKEEREKEEFEDLKFTLEQERQVAANQKQQTEMEKALHQAQLSHELSRISELQVLLDSEKARALELNSALEQEKELRSQLNLSPQRRLEAGESAADAGCSQVEDGVQTMKELLGDLQGQLDEKHTRIVLLLGDMERHKLEAVQERQRHCKALQKEQEAHRLVQDKLLQLQLKNEELQRLLDRERQLVVRLQQERERLQESLSELQDQENQREKTENTDHPDSRTSLCRADIPVDRTRDWVLQQKISDVLKVGARGHSVNEINGGTAAPSDSKHLHGIIQRLQLIASKLKTLTSKASSKIPFEAADDENLIWLQNSVQDIVSQLQQLPAIHPKEEQSVLLPTGSSSSSSLTERLLRQNAELTGFVSRLTEEKNGLRNSLIKLEEEVRHSRQPGLGGLRYSNRKPLDNQDTIDVLTSDQETWSREKDNLEKSLKQAETQVNKLRAELRSDVWYRDMTGSDVDNVTLKRIYGKYLRAESFRKALIYQKKYLLLLLGGFQECEEATLSLIAKMGGRPSHNLEIITPRCRGFTRFRSAVRVTIAISRMKFLVRRWQRAAGSGSSPSSSVNRNGFGQITGNEARTGSPYLHPGGVEAYGDRRTRSELESPRSTLSLQQRYQPAESSAGSLACSHLQNYDPDRALTDYIHRLDALQRRLGSVQSGSTSYAQLHYGTRR
ncbi:A-kinase anchor protein 9-like isoform X3 [Acipenser ruthenus]|uniref:A-kinase anchor protein 9-like isoform X3 n=1 Tax=Acipenser ruthenus TaxID=7906 RepID=UPI0027410EBC|nr:A-kinase anchor protein 9-like isoform X3 [Acipenser ruthenus]